MECPQPAQQGGPEAVDRDPERADGVPDSDEVHVDLGVRVRTSEEFGCDAARLAVLVGAAIEGIRLLDQMPVFGPQDAAVPHEANRAARGVGATAEAEEVELVPRLVILDQEAVALLDVAR